MSQIDYWTYKPNTCWCFVDANLSMGVTALCNYLNWNRISLMVFWQPINGLHVWPKCSLLIDMFWPICQIFPLANRSTDWQSAGPSAIYVMLLAHGKIEYMGQPTGTVVNQYTKFTMLFPSTKLVVTSIHFQWITLSILPPATAHVVPLLLLLYFVLELLYWLSFLYSVLLHSVWLLTQLTQDPGFTLPMTFVTGDKFPQSYLLA
jgi:hypothetical protein